MKHIHRTLILIFAGILLLGLSACGPAEPPPEASGSDSAGLQGSVSQPTDPQPTDPGASDTAPKREYETDPATLLSLTQAEELKGWLTEEAKTYEEIVARYGKPTETIPLRRILSYATEDNGTLFVGPAETGSDLFRFLNHDFPESNFYPPISLLYDAEIGVTTRKELMPHLGTPFQSIGSNPASDYSAFHAQDGWDFAVAFQPAWDENGVLSTLRVFPPDEVIQSLQIGVVTRQEIEALFGETYGPRDGWEITYCTATTRKDVGNHRSLYGFRYDENDVLREIHLICVLAPW